MTYPIEFERVIEALNEARVRYVIVGGVAVVLHGVDRLTADLDVVIDLDREACTAAIESLIKLGYVPRAPVSALDLADPEKRKDWIENRNMKVFSLYDPSNELPVLDIFADYPMDFETLIERAVLFKLGTMEAPVASVPDLIRIKQAAGRERDLLDVMRLNELER